MEAAAIIKKIRAMSGITRKELAQLADVSPSTISRIERGEMDPTWGTMQKIFSATGYQLIGTSVVSSGDTSVIQAASACLAPILIQAYTPKSEALRSATTTVTTRQLPSNMRIPAGEWADRWKRAGWLKDSAGVDDLVAIAVTAGNAGKVARRRGAGSRSRSRKDGVTSSTGWTKRAWTMPCPGSLPHGRTGLMLRQVLR